MTSKILCAGPEETERFGELLGQNLQGGEVIELVSDLGGGKTTLTRGIAHGAGSQGVVSSPTFTLSKLYTAQNFEIHHFDFYRLNEPGLMEHELHDVLEDPQAVLIVEWSGIIQHVLPNDRFTITFSSPSENSRELICSYPESLAYLVEPV